MALVWWKGTPLGSLALIAKWVVTCTGLGLKNDQIFPFGESSWGRCVLKIQQWLGQIFSIVGFKGPSHLFLTKHVCSRWYDPLLMIYKN